MLVHFLHVPELCVPLPVGDTQSHSILSSIIHYIVQLMRPFGQCSSGLELSNGIMRMRSSRFVLSFVRGKRDEEGGGGGGGADCGGGGGA